MATKVRKRSVGMLILSLGPAIFSRAGSAAAAVPPWRRRDFRMRCSPASAPGHSTHSRYPSYIHDRGGCEDLKMPQHLCAPPMWRRTIRPRSELAAQVGGGRLRGALEAEGRDEAALLVHQIGDGGVIHGVAAAVERHLLEVGAIFLGDLG